MSLPGDTKIWRSLDILRFFAALAVLVWHYQNFFSELSVDTYSVSSEQPMQILFRLFYTHGFLAVQFFWTLSGFVLAHRYLNQDRRRFIRNRFARLYPLHLITLIAVLTLQLISNHLFGDSQIYAHNDAFHFLLNLLFIPAIGLEDGVSFNGPVWSVTLEFFAYIVFYLSLIARRSFLFSCISAFLTLVVSLWMRDTTNLILDCIFFFNCGVLAYVCFIRFSKNMLILSFAVLTSVFFILKLIFGFNEIQMYSLDLYLYSLIFCSFIFAGVLLETSFPHTFQNLKSHIQFLGDLTYSSYLWHVPIQILVLLIAKSSTFDLRELLESPIGLIIYVLLTFFVARISFVYIERPLRELIRNFHF
jgi:peptidoglycan/LPS O-acetylase OafA/YrhL